MTKVYLPNAWGSSNVLNIFKHQTPNNDGKWNDIIAVNSKEEADYIISLIVKDMGIEDKFVNIENRKIGE